MKTFDEQIADIEELDELRQQARKLRQEAIAALTASVYRPRPRSGKFNERAAASPGWELPGDDVEKAEVLRALVTLNAMKKGNESVGKRSHDAILKDLASIKLADLQSTKPLGSAAKPPLDSVPVFRCAVILQTLAETPGYALSRPALFCLYRIVQELNEVAGPDWTSGGARADKNSQATAFVTGECARGLLALETALLQTANATRLLAAEAARIKLFSNKVDAWQKQENKFREYSLKVSLATLPRSIVPLSADQDAPSLLRKIVDVLSRISAISSSQFPQGDIRPPRTKREERPNPAYAVEIAKSIAWNSIDRFLATLKIAPADRQFKINRNTDFDRVGDDIAKKLEAAAGILRDLTRPMQQFAESIIDRQLAAASPQLNDLVDGAELVFAATLLGLVSGWKRPKVRAASEILFPLLSTNGRLLSLKPFDVGDKGYRLNVATLDVSRRLADLVAHLDVELEPDFVARLMLPFEYTRVPGAGARGWTTDPQPREPESLWWLTAIALDALESIISMLDATINRLVLQNFQVRQPARLKLALEDLFYPDFGTAAVTGEASAAIRLQQLRAHAGHGPPESRPVYSLILYGPPGTGKTTLVEAVAKTAGVPLVEVTPSDILVGGAEGMERRARQVFQALSKLTHVVILFDEFDSILLDRSKRDPEVIPTSIIEFLTPGMLPKLKALNEASKEGRISYMLATNFVDRLDGAVTRGGRFDYWSGVYPPDPVSRLGRLVDQLQRRQYSDAKKAAKLRADMKREANPGGKRAIRQTLKKLTNRAIDLDKNSRLLKAVRNTRSGPMDKLGRPGWYSMPLDDKDYDATLFGFIITGRKAKKIKPEAVLADEQLKYNKQQARRLNKEVEDLPLPTGDYWDQWSRIEAWDEVFDKPENIDANWGQINKTIKTKLKKDANETYRLAGLPRRS
ncbi:MAG TPA: ATP-binding protein [Bradyrhizobium sp.]|jgi:hypothetical protein|uniref:ATP-binding protein n=1 Tax=Bradyrhizobium sp. TaxID=376 RepID=UPI002C6DC0D9|nr:ATP-binding protein [Bradyrhizobium sp.]HTB04526.1 ATP-binding protein [Bradyrhizobium sp.]